MCDTRQHCLCDVSPLAFIHQIYVFLVYWIKLRLRSVRVTVTLAARSNWHILRLEQQLLAAKLRNLLLFSNPLEVIDII